MGKTVQYESGIHLWCEIFSSFENTKFIIYEIKKIEIAIVKESADNEAASCNVIGSNPTKASSFL